MNRGYFGIGIIGNKYEENLGTLWRSAKLFGCSFIFTIGKRYKTQCTDTGKAANHIPHFEYDTWESFIENKPKGCEVVAIELDKRGTPLKDFTHMEKAIYLLGAEDYGIPENILNQCNRIVYLPGEYSLNVSTAGSIVMYDRHVK